MRTFTGLCACVGIADGKLIRYKKGQKYSKKDIVLLNEFVTQNIILLKDTGAIISSTGGLTCHASLIAREFNIPCIVSVNGLDEINDGASVHVDTAEETVVINDN